MFFRAAAENLDHAFDLKVASHQRIKLLVGSGLCEVARELREQRLLRLIASALFRSGSCGGRFFLRGALQLFANRRKTKAALGEYLRGKALLFAQQAEQEVLGADVFVRKPLGFFGRVGEHALALVRERKVDGGRNLLAHGGVLFNLFADGFDRSVGTKEAVGQRLVFAQQSQQEMFGFDIWRAKLAGLVACEKDNATRLLGVAFEHTPPSKPSPRALRPCCGGAVDDELKWPPTAVFCERKGLVAGRADFQRIACSVPMNRSRCDPGERTTQVVFRRSCGKSVASRFRDGADRVPGGGYGRSATQTRDCA